MQIGDLVRKRIDPENDLGAGLGIIIALAQDRWLVLWANNYGTFWTPEDKLEIVSEYR